MMNFGRKMMKYMNEICVDAGSANCPCPLAETGSCLICSRLAGKEKCECSWCGLCIYNEFMQNDGIVRNERKYIKVPIILKKRYDDDLLTMTVEVDRGMALNAAEPGSFVFLKGDEREMFSVPVSVMRADMHRGLLAFGIKAVSAKTVALAEAEGEVYMRGIYRSGLLGGGAGAKAFDDEKGRWLIITKGIGISPAANLLERLRGKNHVDMVIDSEKINAEFIGDIVGRFEGDENSPDIMMASLAEMESAEKGILKFDSRIIRAADYSRVAILASDYYIKKTAEQMEVPADRLIFSNNFHMCCGEGVCGACSHVDDEGNVKKMCKCSQADVMELL